MAHEIQPAHRPHDQLRTEPAAQREHTDKYVSAITSSSPSVDITFRDPVLQKSADHFKVGIDELTVNLGNLSMLEYSGTDADVLFRIRLRHVDLMDDGNNAQPPVLIHHVVASNFYMHDFTDAGAEAAYIAAVAALAQLAPPGQPGYNPAAYAAAVAERNATLATRDQMRAKWRDAFTFKVDRVYSTLHEVLGRFQEISEALDSYVFTQGLALQASYAGAVVDVFQYAHAAGQPGRYFETTINANGQLRFSGTRAFWANFILHVPKPLYRQIIFKDRTVEFISLHPDTGALRAPFIDLLDGTYRVRPLDPPLNGANPFGAAGLDSIRAAEFVGEGNLLSTIDRRVTIEVGCSLPMKNSPLVDHGVEAPEWVLGRYMFHRPYSVGTHPNTSLAYREPIIEAAGLGAPTLQGLSQRVQYHHLKPQQKINTLRLKLWARVRTYNDSTNTWGMKTIVCPVQDSDYWSIRLHFVEK